MHDFSENRGVNMTEVLPYVITISRQLGSGGAYLGQRLAFRWMPCTWIMKSCVRLHRNSRFRKKTWQSVMKKVTSRWQAILQSFVDTNSWAYDPPPLDTLNDKNLYKVESDIITRIANQRSAVIVGRGGHYVLHKHPRCLSVFLARRYSLSSTACSAVIITSSAAEALKLINSIDQDRGIISRL